MPVKKKRGLSPLMQAFIREYLVDVKRPGDAAIRAGYSPKTASQQAQKLLDNPRVREQIQIEMDKRARRTEITADRVLQELASLGFGNVQDLYDENGEVIPIHKLPRHVAATITEVKERVVRSDGDNVVIDRTYKTADKRGALQDLGKHLKLFTDKMEVDASEELRKFLSGIAPTVGPPSERNR